MTASSPLAVAERKAWSYLLLPRVQDSLVKSTFVPVSFLLAALSPRVHGAGIGSLLVGWAAFEAFAYPARYAVNDLLDRRMDLVHPAARGRGRMPSGLAVWTVVAMVAARLVGAAALTLLLAPQPRVVLQAIGAGAVSTVVYEALRRSVRRRRDMVAPVSWLLYFWVGTGYAIRLGLGTALAGAPGDILAWAAVAGWAFGCMFVVQSWALEGLGLRRTGVDPCDLGKPHVAALCAPSIPNPLLAGCSAEFAAAIAVLALGLATGLGLALSAGSPALAVVLTIGIGAVAHRTRPALPRVRTVVLAILASVLGASSAPASALLAAIPVAIVGVTYLVFTLSDPRLVGFDRVNASQPAGQRPVQP